MVFGDRHRLVPVRPHQRRGRAVRGYNRLKHRPGSYVSLAENSPLGYDPSVNAFVVSTDPAVVYLSAAEGHAHRSTVSEHTLAHESTHQVLARLGETSGEQRRPDAIDRFHDLTGWASAMREDPKFRAYMRRRYSDTPAVRDVNRGVPVVRIPDSVLRLTDRQLAFRNAARRREVR